MKQRNISALARTAAIISMLTIMVAGVTFAALRSQNNVISGNRLTSASANLQMSKQSSGSFGTTLAGYNFLDLAPGGPAGPATGNNLFLKNFGSSNLDLMISMDPTRLVNPNGINLQRAHVVVTDESGLTQFAKYSLAELQAAHASGTPMPLNLALTGIPAGGDTGMVHLKLRMQLDADATSSQQQIELENLDLIFSGTAV